MANDLSNRVCVMKAPQKPINDEVESFPTDGHTKVLAAGGPERTWKPLPPYFLVPCISSAWLFLNCTLCNEPVQEVKPSPEFSESLQSTTEPERGGGNP